MKWLFWLLRAGTCIRGWKEQSQAATSTAQRLSWDRRTWAAPSLPHSPCGCPRLPMAGGTRTRCCGEEEGDSGVAVLSTWTKLRLLSSSVCITVTNEQRLNKCTWLQGLFHHFLFFPTQLPHHWANALMDTYHYLTSDLMGAANKWKAHKIKFTEHHSFCCPLTETIYQVKQIQGMELYSSCINAVTWTFQDPRLSSNCREVLWDQAVTPGSSFRSMRGAPAWEMGGFLFLKAWRSCSQLTAATFLGSAVNLNDSVWFINTQTRDRLDEL